MSRNNDYLSSKRSHRVRNRLYLRENQIDTREIILKWYLGKASEMEGMSWIENLYG